MAMSENDILKEYLTAPSSIIEDTGAVSSEIRRLRDALLEKDNEIIRLKRETNKLKSVIEKSELARMPSIYNSYQQKKKCGVSAGSFAEELDPPFKRVFKDFRARQLIRAAISENDFLKNLETADIVDFMYEQTFLPDEFVIREGEAGSNFYVSAEGQLKVLQGKNYLGTLGPGKAFGELAILYNCKRTASVQASTPCKVWALERRAFQYVMVKAGIQRINDRMAFLRSVPLLKSLDLELLARIADCLEIESYTPGSYIIRQNEAGDTFFIIKEGKVCVTTCDEDIESESFHLHTETIIRELSRGDYFGEQALLREERRSANVIAMPPGVDVLSLDRESFLQLIGDLSEFHQHRKRNMSPARVCHHKTTLQNDEEVNFPSSKVVVPVKILESIGKVESDWGNVTHDFDYTKLHLNDLDVIVNLGSGGFGRVALVQVSYDKNQVFALKCLPKVHILATQQQEHVFSEKNIMLSCNNPFVTRLYKTFKDDKYVYLLMEALLGGEVWSLLRDRGNFDEDTTRFISACVLFALEYLHDRHIVYRDLKPENLMLGNDGYVKLVDFGFSKIVPSGQRTWTFCGTPEYCAPEVILNRGHDRMVDFWALGILLYELLTGLPPWGPMSENGPANDDPLIIYNAVLKGVESINFTRGCTRAGVSLIRRLCRQAPGERLGANKGVKEIMSHRFFQAFDWEGLRSRRMKPPIPVNLRGPTDHSNFDKFELTIEDIASDLSGWDEDF